MKAGTRSSATIRPLTNPTTAPAMEAGRDTRPDPEGGHDAERDGARERRDGSDGESKLPLAMTRVMPRPTIATTAALVRTLTRFPSTRNRGVSTVRTSPTATTNSPTR